MLDFSDQPNIFLGISEKAGGNMRLVDDAGHIRPDAARKKFFAKRGLDNTNVVSPVLVHGSNVVAVADADKGKIIADCDALITGRPGVILTITAADCLPVYFYDSRRNVIALAHAGWRGIGANIAAEVVKEMVETYGSEPADIQVFIAPHIKKCHFAAKDGVVEKLAAYPEYISRKEKIYIDLGGIARSQLIAAGVPARNINISPECTYCLADKYFSYRRQPEAELETMIAYIGIKQ